MRVKSEASATEGRTKSSLTATPQVQGPKRSVVSCRNRISYMEDPSRQPIRNHAPLLTVPPYWDLEGPLTTGTERLAAAYGPLAKHTEVLGLPKHPNNPEARRDGPPVAVAA